MLKLIQNELGLIEQLAECDVLDGIDPLHADRVIALAVLNRGKDHDREENTASPIYQAMFKLVDA
jgi:hypothetical protein